MHGAGGEHSTRGHGGKHDTHRDAGFGLGSRNPQTRLRSGRAGVDRSVLWSIEADAGRRTGRFPTADFMGAGFNDARGDWLSQPQAVRPGGLHAWGLRAWEGLARVQRCW